LKITDVETTNILIPNKFELGISSMLHLGKGACILQVHTDEEIVGLGEASQAPGGSPAKQLIDDVAKPILVGEDPFHASFLETKLQSALMGNDGVLGAITTALWDIMGKAVGRPVCDLIGGRCRSKVEFFGYMHPGYIGKEGIEHDLEIPYGADVSRVSHGEGGRFPPDEVAKFAKWLIRKYGFRVLELKTGLQTPKADIEIVRVLRDEIGPDMPIKIDTNQSWTPEIAIRTLNAMKKYDLKNVEDPTKPLSAIMKVRSATGIPMSTHSGFYYGLSSIVASGIDNVVPNMMFSGGAMQTKKIVAVAEQYGLGCWLHTSGDLGITATMMIHFLASTPYIVEPSQTGHDIRNLDDIVEHVYGSYKGPLPIKDGCAVVPEGPGLGVELNEKKLEKYHELWVDEAKKAGRKYFFDWHAGGAYPDYHEPKWFPTPWAWITRMDEETTTRTYE